MIADLEKQIMEIEKNECVLFVDSFLKNKNDLFKIIDDINIKIKQ